MPCKSRLCFFIFLIYEKIQFKSKRLANLFSVYGMRFQTSLCKGILTREIWGEGRRSVDLIRNFKMFVSAMKSCTKYILMVYQS